MSERGGCAHVRKFRDGECHVMTYQLGAYACVRAQPQNGL